MKFLLILQERELENLRKTFKLYQGKQDNNESLQEILLKKIFRFRKYKD